MATFLTDAGVSVARPRASVIIPIYNAGPYLDKCLDSIEGQTVDDIEIICIVDGATDNSMEIAELHAKNDGRIRIFWQENAGAGPARNHGIDESQSEYIIFVDPDDWVEPDYVSRLISKAEQYDADLVTAPLICEQVSKQGNIVAIGKASVEERFLEGSETLRDNYVTLYLERLLGGPVCKVYRKSVIDQGGVRFPPARRSQDILFNIEYYFSAGSVALCSDCGYHYQIFTNKSLNKVPDNYYRTVVSIYHNINQHYSELGVHMDATQESLLCGDLFMRILACIEALIVQEKSFDDVAHDRDVLHIACKAKEMDIYRRTARWLLLHDALGPLRMLSMTKLACMDLKRNVLSRRMGNIYQ